MHHLSRALATARIDDLLRDAAQTHMIRLARRVTHEAHVAASNVADTTPSPASHLARTPTSTRSAVTTSTDNRQPPVNSGRYARSRTSTELARRRRWA